MKDKFSGVSPKELREMYRECERQGAVVSYTGSTHVRVQTDKGVTFQPSTGTAKGRGLLNAKAQLRKLGIKL